MTTYEDVLAALSDPTRRRVLEKLRGGPLSVTDIAEGLPVSRPAVSQHLKVLRDAGLVECLPRGTCRLYRPSSRGFSILRRYLESWWDVVLTAFAEAADAAETPQEGSSNDSRV